MLIIYEIILLASVTTTWGQCYLKYQSPVEYSYNGTSSGDQICLQCCKGQDRFINVRRYAPNSRFWDYRIGCYCHQIYEDLEKFRKPKGDNCGWYSSCLNRFSTSPLRPGSFGGYALNYGDKYCYKYDRNIFKFSGKGQNWIRNTKKCLQEALAPYVNTNITEDTLKDKAFASHTRCYVDNGLCELPVSDWKEIVSTVGDALLSEFLKTGDNVIQTGAECAVRIAGAGLRATRDGVDKLIEKGKGAIDTVNTVKDTVSDTIDTVNAIKQKFADLKKIFQNDIKPVVFG